MKLQPLYDVKERLEQAAIAGTGLLGEDFRLQRALEGLKPLAAASPVFAKIDAGLQALLAAPAGERGGRLLDLLALVDAVAYTQGSTGIMGELEPLPTGGGTYCQISYGQLQPLLTALTSTGGGRQEMIRSAWENHPEWCSDFRVLPALAAGLGDSYGEIAALNAQILKGLGRSVLPLLKEGFDPAGKKEMVRRVEVLAAVEGAKASPWLREVLPDAKKDVRAAVIRALGNDGENVPLLLDLTKSERGANRDAALEALAKQDGEAVAAFWREELDKEPGSGLFLQNTNADWAGDLIATGLRQRLEAMLAGDYVTEEFTIFTRWCQAIGQKSSPGMLDFWRWADEHMEALDRLTNQKGNSVFAGVTLTDALRTCMRLTGPGPLRDFCLTLFDRRSEMTRYLHISFQAALLSLPAVEVFEKFAPYILTEEPAGDAERQKTLNTVLLRALGDVWWHHHEKKYVVFGGQPTAEPLDVRWIERLTQAVYTDVPKRGSGASPFACYWENIAEFDLTLMRLVNPEDEPSRRLLIPYLRRRLEETGQPYTYSRWLFRLGGSPRGMLGRALAKRPNNNRGYVVWQLMYDAWQALSVEETIALLEEVLAQGAFQKQAAPHIQKAIPWTIEQLRAGQEFPSNISWSKL